MKITTILVFVAYAVMLTLNPQPLISQAKLTEKSTSPQAYNKEFAEQWKHVKEKYPLVAMQYLRTEAFTHQVARVLLDKRLFGDNQMVQAESYFLAHLLCKYYTEFQIPLPIECGEILNPPRIDISSCFEPKLNGEMPSVQEAEDCLKEKRRGR